MKLQIPLNPPLKKGDFKKAAVFSPLFSRGVGGIFSPGATNSEVMDVSLAPNTKKQSKDYFLSF